MFGETIRAKIRTRYVKNILTLLTGTTIAQAIPLLISPLLTRIYTPHDYGLLALFLAVTSIIGVIATARYELAVVLPKKQEDAANVVTLCFLITFGISLVTLITVYCLKQKIASWLSNPDIEIWLWYVPGSVFLTGIYQTMSYWSNRHKEFKRIAVSRVVQSTSTGLVNIGGYHTGALGLIGGNLLGQLIGTIVLGWQVVRKDWNKKRMVTRAKIIWNAKLYQDFPKVNTFHAFSDMLLWSGVSFLIMKFYGVLYLGYYSLTLRMIQAPLGLIGTSVSQVFFQSATEIYQTKGDLQKFVFKNMMQLSMLSIPIFVILALFAPRLFLLLFGPNWKDAGEFAQYLTPWFLLKFIISPVSQIPIIVNKQKAAFLLGVCSNLLQLGVLYVSAKESSDIHTSLISAGVFGSLLTLGYGIWIYQISRHASKISLES